MNDISKMWQTALVKIEASVTKANFSTWFKEVTALRKKGRTLYLGVPNSFTQEWLQKKFHEDILLVLKKIDSKINVIKYEIIKDGKTVTELDWYTKWAIEHYTETRAVEIKRKADFDWLERAKSGDLNVARKAFLERWTPIKENLKDKRKLDILRKKFHLK